MFYYAIYGLYLVSNRPLPGLRPLPDAREPDVYVCLEGRPVEFDGSDSAESVTRYDSPYKNKDGEPLLVVRQLTAGSPYHWAYNDGTEFWIDAGGLRIWATWPDTETLEGTSTYLVGPVLGFVLRLRGVSCLHASAIVVDGKAVALLGPPGAGKSTSVARFAQLGFPVISEDVVTLDGRSDTLLVQPGYPGLRLWPASVSTLCGSVDALPRIMPNWNKRYLDLSANGYTFKQHPVPLGGIYMLGQRSTGATAPVITPLSGHEGFMTLVSNSYTNYLLDRSMRSQEFETLARTVKSLPVRHVTPSADINDLSKLCHTIVDDFSRSSLYMRML